ncbi:MAG: CRISPR-associated helicase Cas3' [Candidatus Heimdallarchaeaceae archaeon]
MATRNKEREEEEFTFLARPNQTLARHLTNMLKELIALKKDYYNLFREKSEKSNDIERFFFELLIVAHDFGKINPFFQDKIKRKKKSKVKKTLTYHSQLSGLFCWLLGSKARDYLVAEDKKIETEFNKHFISVIFAILNHHNIGKLPNTITYSIRKYGTGFTYEDLSEIIREINVRYLNNNTEENEFYYNYPKKEKEQKNLINNFFEKFSYETILPKNILLETIEHLLELTDPEDIELLFDEIEELWYEVVKDNRLFMLILFYFSILCDLDEWDAKSHIEDTEKHFMNFENKMVKIEKEKVENFRKEKFAPIDEKTEDELLKLKKELWENSCSYLQEKKEEDIISVTYPTGSGKTLSFLHLAFNLREEEYKKTSCYPRIIYCLPFISITDQIGEILKEILFKERKIKQTDILTIHHHLAESEWSYYSENQEKDEYNVSLNKDYIYLWNANIIVTTFVSFWNSLLGGKKRNLLRFHRIASSIIIFDEIQTIPIKYWQLISTFIHQLTNILGCKVILGSATNPRALSVPYEWNEYQGKIFEIKYQSEKRKLDRYTIYYDGKRKDLVEFSLEASKFIEENPEKSIMFVMNTKESARLLFDFLKEEHKDEPIYFLSSVVTHEDRVRIIEKLKEKEEKRILVCTQVIEAGVDVTFDVVFRDLAPLDSIIQVAGRCNRYNEEKGIVKVVELVKPETKNTTYYRMIYDLVMIQETRKILEKNKKIEENQIHEIITDYYDKLTLKGEKKVTDVGVKEINNTEIENLSEKFKLIEEMENETIIIIDSKKEYWELIKKVDTAKGKKFLMDYRTKAIALTKKQKRLLKEKIDDKNKLFIISAEEEGEILGYLKEKDDKYYSKNGGFNIPLIYGTKKISEYKKE